MTRYTVDPAAETLAAVRGPAVLLMPRTAWLQHDGLWSALGSGDAVASVLGELTRQGIAGLPDFALAVATPAGVRVVVRGGYLVRVGDATVTAAGASTWHERLIEGGHEVEVRAAGAPAIGSGAAGESLPIVEGAVPAVAVQRTVEGVSSSADASEPAPAASASSAVVSTEPEPDPEPEPEPGVELRPVPDVELASATAPESDAAIAPPTPAVASAPSAPAPTAPAVVAEAIAPMRPVVPLIPPPAPSVSPIAQPPVPVTNASEPVEAPVSQATAPEHTLVPTDDDTIVIGGVDAGAPSDPGTDGDHDGLTVAVTKMQQLRRQRAKGPLADADADAGADAGAALAAPPALRLRLPDGREEPLTGEVVLGRAPSVTRATGTALPRLVTIGAGDPDISRSHLRIGLEGGTVVVTDLHSRNGTSVVQPGRAPVKLRAGEPTPVLAGTVVDLGGGWTLQVVGG